MSGVAILRALLLANTNVTAVTPRVVAGILPQGTVLPAIGVSEVSSNEERTVARNLPVKMIRERVQVTVLTQGLPAVAYFQMKKLLKAAALGPGVHTGVVLGFRVCSILPEGVGPEIPPADDGIYEQSRDFMVTFLEAN